MRDGLKTCILYFTVFIYFLSLHVCVCCRLCMLTVSLCPLEAKSPNNYPSLYISFFFAEKKKYIYNKFLFILSCSLR